MTQKQFLYDLRRGLGSAILELKRNPDKIKYKEILLRCCLKDIAFDAYTDGTKGVYLYTAICTLGCEAEFLPYLKSKFMKNLDFDTFCQIEETLEQYYWQNKNDKVLEIFKEKLILLKDNLLKCKASSFNCFERGQSDYLMTFLMKVEGWSGFVKYIKEIGDILQVEDKEYSHFYFYEDFLFSSKKIFGKKRVENYIQKASKTNKAVNVVKFTWEKHILQEERDRAEAKNKKKYTIEEIIEAVKKTVVGSRYCAENRDKIWQFQQDAKQRDIRKLAAYAEKEEDERIFVRILGDFFDWRAYPLKPDKILRLALSENKMHRKYAFEALRNLKDDRIHTVGVELLKSGDIENGLPLFCKNWQEGDDELIYLAIKAQPKIKLWMQARIAEIYTQHASSQSGKVLRYVYKKARCTSYRYKIVQAMEKNGVLTSAILQECLYDSYKETREWAKRVVTQRGMSMGDNV